MSQKNVTHAETLAIAVTSPTSATHRPFTRVASKRQSPSHSTVPQCLQGRVCMVAKSSTRVIG